SRCCSALCCSLEPRHTHPPPPSLHDALPIYLAPHAVEGEAERGERRVQGGDRIPVYPARDAQTEEETGRVGPAQILHAQAELHRSEEHTSELQSREKLVCRLLLEKKHALNET